MFTGTFPVRKPAERTTLRTANRIETVPNLRLHKMNTASTSPTPLSPSDAGLGTLRLQRRTAALRRVLMLEQQGIPPLLARLYAARGIETAADLDYEFRTLLPPDTLTHADRAARLLADAIAAGQRILIVADYDCDGATACAVGIRALRAFGATVDYLVPNRFTHGYGLTPAIVDLAAAPSTPPQLIVTVDNGIASIDGIGRAKALGIATLITDHHLPGDVLPDADCIVNPNQPGCAFASKHIAGVGVMFYVMLALRAELRARGGFEQRPEPNLATLLDLVALGTVADVVPLDRNNRLLVSQGLRRMRGGRLNSGIKALFAAAGRDPAKATIQDIGFMIGPRLNAAGRLDDMTLGIECLLTDDDARALAIAQRLDELNRERRRIEGEMREQAGALLGAIDGIGSANDDDGDGGDGNAAIALFDPDWHQGVIGILAARLKDRLHRPVFAFAPGDGDEIKGSGRSTTGFHLRDALDLMSKRAPDLLLRFGGHAAAAGATLKRADFPRFAALFAEIAATLIAPEDRARTLITDGPLENAYLSLENAHLLENQVWGHGFPPPLFEGEFTVVERRILKEKHLKLKLDLNGASFEAIQFNFTADAGERIRAVYRLNVNEFRGVENVQLYLEHFENL